jgi:UDP-3-O-acyl-N-acetylglucosamine deacetylase
MPRKTIRNATTVSGVGLHSGIVSTVALHPGLTGDGILARFGNGPFQAISSLNVIATDRCTRIEFLNGATVDTVEHLFAAIALLGITDIRLTFSNREVPILDGSASDWISSFENAGIVQLLGAAEHFIVTRPFKFAIKGALYQVSPGPAGFRVSIDFANPHIGFQEISVRGANLATLADSRTFALETEIAALQAAGLALGGGLHNAVVVGADGPLNPEGFRHPDECVRHKALDLVGDLLLAGCPILGDFTVHRPGHSANNAFLKAMLAAGILSRSSDAAQSRAA